MKRVPNNWICDVCGKVIGNISDGYVVWQSDDSERDYGFKIIHQKRCDDKANTLSSPLSDFIGEEGVQFLLSMLSVGKAQLMSDRSEFKDRMYLDDWVDLYRRVQTPGYEQARTLFSHPEVREYLCDQGEYAPYLPETLDKILKIGQSISMVTTL